MRARGLRSSTLSPYTTLFRSARGFDARSRLHLEIIASRDLPGGIRGHGQLARAELRIRGKLVEACDAVQGYTHDACTRGRSEEHTSELQSQSNLVCRLLLEKK